MIKRIARGVGRRVSAQIARHRRFYPLRKLNDVCVSYHKSFENCDYSETTNGEQRVMRQMGLADVRCIFDVGANRGLWASLAHAAMPAARIHSFEVVPDTFEKLKKTVGGIPQVTANKFGLSDQEGSIELNLADASDGLSSAYAIVSERSSRKVTGQVRKGDDYFRECGATSIDFLKIDVEGMEHLVLRGLSQTLTTGAVRAIQFEYGMVNIETGFLLKNFYDVLIPHGFLIGKIYPTYVAFAGYTHDQEDFIGPNYLAVHRDQIKLIDLLK